MDDLTFKLLEKALLANPEDWEMRAHLLEACLDNGRTTQAEDLLRAASSIPANEQAQLLQARVELESDPSGAIVTLERLLTTHKACAPAYLLLARVYQKRGLKEEARRKYGAATIIDPHLYDASLAGWLGTDLPDSPPTPPAPEAPPSPESFEEYASSGDEPVQFAREDRGQQQQAAIDDAPDPELQPETSKITFSDIGGMTEIIERIRMNIIYPFKNPEIFKKFKQRAGGGILLYGPPGCGKTYLARATAGECGARFYSIGITDILSKWIGESERRLHQIFETARRHKPSVLFIDEIDSLGMSRSDAGSYQAPLVNVLLTELDGFQASNDNVMVLAATNTPWRVDNALRRPGRFDRVLFVPPPDATAREAILKLHLQDIPARGLDLARIARQCERFSGADLRGLVERASEKAIYQEMRTGRPAELTQPMLMEALKETRPSTVEWLDTAKSYATYANTAGLYDELVEYFEK